MNQKATVEFDAQAKMLTIKGELLPGTALEHDMLCDLLFGDQPKRRMQVSMDLNVITYECVIETADPVIVPATITGLPSGTDLDKIEDERKLAAQAQDGLPDFSNQSVRDGYWEIYHDDSCGEILVNDKCPKCGFSPDLQSRGARRTGKVAPKLGTTEEAEAALIAGLASLTQTGTN